MPTRVRTFSIDCNDPYTLAQFWSKLLDAPLGEDDFPGDPEVLVQLPEGPPLLFLQVPEPKTVKNRMHMCLEPQTTRDVEVERVLELGGTIFDDRRNPDGTGWVVFTDPEGNEFCVLRSQAERAATS
ncbi:VOC family protein [Actinopolymorpha sp. NPDC004070]|uniref:VOC family protein n=1 Tax=Actinopolymorpha sp. NPDC004070 TaxID=3154548 RepID=UPI0033BA4F35